MKFVVIKNRGYPQDTPHYGMEILAYWFTDDVGGYAKSWIRWVNDESEAAEATESNATWLEKYKDQIIFGSIIDMIQSKGILFEPTDDQMISVPKKNVIELLKTWEQLLKTQPQQIMITEEDGVFKMFEVQ